MLAIYYTLLFLVCLIAGPFILLFKKKARAGLSQKLGFVPADFKSTDFRSPLWFHAVSVGEFNAVWPLVLSLHEKYPEQAIVISTTTLTGQELAKSKAGGFAKVFYFPFDLPWGARNWLKTIKPRAVLIVETELWPGFYDVCSKLDIPAIVVNGRMSPRSFKQYMSLHGLIGEALSKTSLILAQSKQEAERYRELAGAAADIRVTGNLKFDGLKPIEASERQALQKQLTLNDDDLVIVGGSTHEGEESVLLSATQALREAGLKPRLILVPRHPERFKRAADIVAKYGFSAIRFSNNDSFKSDDEVYILDTIGQLNRFYSIANIAFVGGTVAPIGGHNLVEPCAYSVPVVCGPHVHKTRDVARALVANDALLLNQDDQELIDNIVILAKDPELRKTIGANGCAFLAESQGAVKRALHYLEKFGNLLDSNYSNPEHLNTGNKYDDSSQSGPYKESTDSRENQSLETGISSLINPLAWRESLLTTLLSKVQSLMNCAQWIIRSHRGRTKIWGVAR